MIFSHELSNKRENVFYVPKKCQLFLNNQQTEKKHQVYEKKKVRKVQSFLSTNYEKACDVFKRESFSFIYVNINENFCAYEK